jgi:hypothetical protein
MRINGVRCGALLAVLLLLVGTPSGVMAQGSLGRLAGTVLDTSSAVLPGATVTLVNQQTNETRTTVTTGTGAFVFPQLQPGLYKVTVELTGFKTVTFANVQVNAGQEYSITAKLEVGGIAETVEVTAGTTLVQTTTPEVSQTVQQKQVLELPLNGRDITALIRMQAGVPGVATRMNTGINGGRPTWTQVTQDGINIQDNFIRTNSLDFLPNRPSSDSVAEISITTSVSGADTAGGASTVRMITPSGSNKYRGSAWWANRDSALSANSFFNNKSGVPKPALKRNQPGFRLGGPIKKDKIFFFGYYEGFRLKTATSQNLTLAANDDFYNGVFRYVGTDGQVRSVNILTATNSTRDAAFYKDVLSRIPTASNVNNYDVGNSKAGQVLNTAGYRFNQQHLTTRDYFGGRVDMEVSANHHIEAIVTYSRDTDDRPDLDFTSPDRPLVFTSSPVKRAVGAWRWMASPRLQNEVRVGMNLAPVRFDSNFQYGTVRYSGQAVQLMSGYIQNPDVSFLPQGRNTNTYQFNDNANLSWGNHALQMGASWQKIHVNPYNYEGTIPTVNLGFSSASTATQLNASMFPGGIASGDLANANTALALLTGRISNMTQTFQVKDQTSGFVSGQFSDRNFSLNNIAAYIQDSWRLKPNFTIRAGLKWEYYSPLREDNNLGFFPVLNGGSYTDVLKNPNATVTFVNGGIYSPDRNNFGPTIGFAWDVFKDGRTSVRGGYSLTFVNEESVTVGQAAMGFNAGLSTGATLSNQTTTISGGIPSVPTPVFKPVRTLADQMAVSATGSMGIIDPNITQPKVHQVSIGIQHELKWGFAGEARYVGTFGRDIWKAIDYNQVAIPQTFLDDFTRARANGFLALTAKGLFNPAYDATIAGSQPLTVLPTFGGGFLTNSTVRTNIQQNEVGSLADFYMTSRVAGALAAFYPNGGIYSSVGVTNLGWQNYNALQIDLRREMRQGITGALNYTWAHTRANGGGNAQNRLEAYLDNNRPQLDEARSLWNITHMINANIIAELPFGQGKRWLNSGGIGNAVLGDWQISAILHWQTGNPLSILAPRGTFNRVGRSGNETAVTSLTPEQIKALFKITKLPDGRIFWIDPSVVDPNTGRAVGTDTLTNSAGFAGQVFFNPTAGNVGSLEQLAFDAPATTTVDASLSKRIRFGRYIVEVRAEAFNLLNSVEFYSGDMNINSTTFGRLTGTVVAPRVIQLQARFSF